MIREHVMESRRKFPRFWTLAWVSAAAAGLAVPSGVQAQTGPKIFDWSIHHNNPVSTAVPQINPVPWVDQYNYWNSASVLATYQTYQYEAGKYVSILLRNEPDAPEVNHYYFKQDSANQSWWHSDGFIKKIVNGVTTTYYDLSEATATLAAHDKYERLALSNTLNWLKNTSNIGRLDYLFMDFEDNSHFYNDEPLRNANSRTAAQQAKATFPSVHVGNYADYPGPEDLSAPFSSRIDRTQDWSRSNTDSHAFYLGSGLNVAMPNCYPYSYFINHAVASQWGDFRGGDFTSPTQRSAMFWAPLERLSVAARALPADHELIPWVNDFIQWTSNGVPVYVPAAGQTPTLEDNKASITHYRLRGADGYYEFAPSADPDTYRQTIYQGWTSLDPVFGHDGALRILNLATNKTAGIEWSAAQKGNRVMALVSNLNTMSQSVDWSGNLSLPSQSPSVAPGAHVLLQYHSHYLDNNDMEQYTLGNAMNSQGDNSWKGPNANLFAALAPAGSGNASPQMAAHTGAYGVLNKAWLDAENPGYASTDKVVYSAWMYGTSSTIGFQPLNAAGTASGAYVATSQEGPFVSLYWQDLRIRGRISGGDVYQAVNFPATQQKWYEVQLVVDPAANKGSMFARNVTDGQKDFTRVIFDNTTTTGTTERLLNVPLLLSSGRTTTDFNAWGVAAYGTNGAVDNLNTGYYAPRLNDNFEHYQTGVTNNNQTTTELAWYGPATHGPSEWEVTAPINATGNSSALAARPTASAYTPKAWWKVERPDFTSAEPVVYSAMLYGTSGVGFLPVNTDGSGTSALTANNRVGFYTYIYWGAFRFRGSRDAGDVYAATNLTAQSGKWYDVQVQIDPTRDIDGTTGESYGVARVWVKNLTDGTAPVLLTFDNLNTTGSTESLTELPMKLTSISNPTLWDGWEVYGYNSAVQIDGLRSFPFPYADYQSHNTYIESGINSAY